MTQGQNETLEPTHRPTVFICYAKEDVEKAEQLFDLLAAAGASPWMDKHRLVLGDPWEEEIKRAVLRADAFVVCLRRGFDEIGYRQREVRWALEALAIRPPGRGFIIPFLLESCELPRWCHSFHAGSDLARPGNPLDVVAAIEKHCQITLQPDPDSAIRMDRLGQFMHIWREILHACDDLCKRKSSHRPRSFQERWATLVELTRTGRLSRSTYARLRRINNIREIVLYSHSDYSELTEEVMTVANRVLNELESC